MPKVRRATNQAGEVTYHEFRCPGCKEVHMLPTEGLHKWDFNGDLENPTFTPSILCRGVERMTEEEYARVKNGEHIEPRPFTCHSFVTNGRIQFLSDCTHALKDQTVEIPKWELEEI